MGYKFPFFNVKIYRNVLSWKWKEAKNDEEMWLQKINNR